MKILEEKYPKGTFKHQKSDGRFIDGYLYENIETLAKRIVDDMTFLGIVYSSTLEVGTGKSVLCTQMGETWSYLMKKIHNIDVPFTMNNIVFKPKDLIERAFKVPKYSFILLDEWEDAHYWSELGMSLRKFFRKCRQLNLFMMVIIPSFFQMPISYAVSRSVFAIDVKFEQDFQRGFFSFYSFNKKKELYIKGKKFYNYNVVRPDFDGRFFDGYGVDEETYRATKLRDMQEFDEDEQRPSKATIEKEVKAKIAYNVVNNDTGMTTKILAQAYGCSERTIQQYAKDYREGKIGGVPEREVRTEDYNNLPTTLDDDGYDVVTK